MRVALLYGDIEWQAGGASELSYSASDYARRMGFHRHTVHADFSHLLTLGAVSVSYDQKHHPIVRLNSLVAVALPATADGDSSASTLSIVSPSPGDSIDAPLSIPSTSPCRSHRHPPVDALANPLSKPSTAIEKTSKTQEKEDRKKKRGKPARSSALQRQGEEQPTSLQKPEAGSSRAGRKAAEPEPSAPPEPSEAGAEPETAEPTTGPGGSGLLDRLLAAFRASAPPEWPAPERLTVSRERRCRLRQALEHAGNVEALESRLRAALSAVPAWYRNTYPVRPDGSRRPAYQFFDLLFRASASERECGMEAWHLFAWSEGGRAATPWVAGATAATAATDSPQGDEQRDLQIARRWFTWGAGQWSIRDIQAFKVTPAEQRRLTGLLEAAGVGEVGAGARQFLDSPDAEGPSEPQEVQQEASGEAGEGDAIEVASTASRLPSGSPQPASFGSAGGRPPAPWPHPADGLAAGAHVRKP